MGFYRMLLLKYYVAGIILLLLIGIVKNTLATGKRPWYNRSHDINLAKNICDGGKLEIPDDTPKFYAELMQRCWGNDPERRPTALYLNEKLGEWIILICDDPNPSEISDESSIAEEKRWKMISRLPKNYNHPEIHPEAFYMSCISSNYKKAVNISLRFIIFVFF